MAKTDLDETLAKYEAECRQTVDRALAAKDFRWAEFASGVVYGVMSVRERLKRLEPKDRGRDGK